MELSTFRNANRREIQLDIISSLLIVAMAVVVSILLYLFSSYGLKLPATVPLASYVERVLLGGFVLVVVAYLWDQRARLRDKVRGALEEAEEARLDLERTCDYLTFSHQAASELGELGVEEAMCKVLSDAATLFEADSAAVLGPDAEYTFVADGIPPDEAVRALTRVEALAAGRGTPIHVGAVGAESGCTIAASLRVRGDLRYMLAMWRRDGEFEAHQRDALGLMGRMIELALEREESLAEAQEQLEGTLRALQYVVADKRPDYSRHSTDVAELAAAIGQKMGLSATARKGLRLAGLVHDVGMMNLPGEVGDAGRSLTEAEWNLVRQHASVGSEIARAANFPLLVQNAIAGHHERMDGSGYPLGLRGSRIPIEARIIAVCETYDSMTHRSYHAANGAPESAILELVRGAGSLYDRDVVSALVQVIDEATAEPSATGLEREHSEASRSA